MIKKLILFSMLITILLFVLVVGHSIVFLAKNSATNSAPWQTALLYPGIIFYIIFLIECIVFCVIKK